MALFLFDLPRKEIQLNAVQLSPTGQIQTLDGAVRASYKNEIRHFQAEHAAHALQKGFDPEHNPIFTLESFDKSNGDRTFSLGSVEFRDYYALKKLLYQHPSDKQLLQQFVTLSMIVHLETADHYLVLGHRGGEHLPNRYLPPAGFHEYDSLLSQNYFRDKCIEEITEETGIPFAGQISYIGLTGDTRDSFLDVCVFLAKTEKTAAEVENCFQSSGAKDEHSHLIYLPSNAVAICSFLRGNYSGVLNPFQDIVFKNGSCVRGPAEIKNKQYKQIENGIGAFAAYLSLTMRPEQLQEALAQVVATGNLSGVVEKQLRRGISPFLLSPR